MNSLDRTIMALQRIKYNLDNQRLLIKSLQCLRDTVGNNAIKQTIANNVNALVMFRDTHCSSDGLTVAEIMEMPKLHTVIYGSPGTGKTLLAKILAAIWISIGLIIDKKNKRSKDSTVKSHGVWKAPLDPSDVSDHLLKPNLIDLVGTLILFYCTLKILMYCWNKSDLDLKLHLNPWESFFLKIFLTSGFVFLFVLPLKNKIQRTLQNISAKTGISGKGDSANEKGNQKNNTRNTDSVLDGKGNNKTDSGADHEVDVDVKVNFFEKYAEVLKNDKVNIRSPADFIGKFLGFTADKTRNVLEESLGKVLFVDEAYGIMPRGDHMYGKEALNEMTSFIDSHQGEIVLVFAGYEDNLREGVFAAQKGLDRRFGLHITCSGYTKQELFDMLKNKLECHGMCMTDADECYSVFFTGDYVYMAGDMDIMMDYLREPFAESYILSKANSSDAMSEDSGFVEGDDSNDNSNAEELDVTEGKRRMELLKLSTKITPDMMQIAVDRMNSRKYKTDKAKSSPHNPVASLLNILGGVTQDR